MNYAIITQDSTLKNEPDKRGKIVGNLYEGYRVKVLRENSGYCFVNFRNKVSGWINKDKFKEINIPKDL